MNLMHFFKISALVIFTSLLFSACSKEEVEIGGKGEVESMKCDKTETEQVWMELTNQTEETLVGFTLGGEEIGDLAPGESFCKVSSSIVLDGAIPVLDMKAEVNDEIITSYCFFCGTMMREVEEGDFNMDIQLLSGYNEAQYLMAYPAPEE